MAKMRIHEFAKEIEKSSGEIIACLEELGVEGRKKIRSPQRHR